MNTVHLSKSKCLPSLSECKNILWAKAWRNTQRETPYFHHRTIISILNSAVNKRWYAQAPALALLINDGPVIYASTSQVSQALGVQLVCWKAESSRGLRHVGFPLFQHWERASKQSWRPLISSPERGRVEGGRVEGRVVRETKMADEVV